MTLKDPVNPDFKGTPLFDVQCLRHDTRQDTRLLQTTLVESDMWRIEVANDLDQPSRSLQLFSSENKCSLLFQSLIERPGDLMKDDIAEDLE